MSESDDYLDPQLQSALQRLKAITEDNPEAAARGRAHFLAQATSFRQAVSQRANRRHSRWFNPPSWQLSRAMFVIVLLMVSLLLAGTGATVYAAQDSLPNTPLYPVKILSEDTLTALTFQPETKLDLLLSYADRRVDEIAALNLQGTLPPESVTRRLDQQLNAAIALGAEVSDSELAQTLERVEATIRRQEETLAQVQSQVGEPAKPVLARVRVMLEERLRVIKLGLTDPPTFRQQMRGSGRQVVTPGQEHKSTVTPPGPERRSTVIPPGQERRSTVTPPGQERRPTTPPGQERRPTPPPAQEHRP